MKITNVIKDDNGIAWFTIGQQSFGAKSGVLMSGDGIPFNDCRPLVASILDSIESLTPETELVRCALDKDALRCKIAKEFIELHKNPVEEWAPFFDDSDDQYLDIYYQLVDGEYGCVSGGQIEINSFESKTRNPVIFDLFEAQELGDL